MAKRKQFTIPDGYSLEEITELAEQLLRDRRNEYNKNHPEIIEQQRLRTYSNYLRRHGMFVMNAELPQPPWTELQEKYILQAVRANMEGKRNV